MSIETSMVFASAQDTAGQEKFQSVTTQQSTPETSCFIRNVVPCSPSVPAERLSCSVSLQSPAATNCCLCKELGVNTFGANMV